MGGDLRACSPHVQGTSPRGPKRSSQGLASKDWQSIPGRDTISCTPESDTPPHLDVTESLRPVGEANTNHL